MDTQPKKKKKRIFLIIPLLLIPLVILFFLFRENSGTDLSHGSISQVQVICGGENTVYEDEETVNLLRDLVQNGIPLSEAAKPLEEYTRAELTFRKLRNNVVCTLYLTDSPVDCLFSDSEENLFRIPAETAEKLLSLPFFHHIVSTDDVPPEAVLSAGEEKILPASRSGEWHYTDLNGTLQTEKIEESAEKSGVFPQGTAFSFVFDKEPAYCNVRILNEKGEILASGEPETLPSSLPLEKDEPITVQLNAAWYENDENNYYGEIDYTFSVLYDLPAAAESAVTAAPGETATIRVSNSASSDFAVSTSFSVGKVTVTEDGCDRLLSFTVPESTAPGEYRLALMGSDLEAEVLLTVALPETGNPENPPV